MNAQIPSYEYRPPAYNPDYIPSAPTQDILLDFSSFEPAPQQNHQTHQSQLSYDIPQQTQLYPIPTSTSAGTGGPQHVPNTSYVATNTNYSPNVRPESTHRQSMVSSTQSVPVIQNLPQVIRTERSASARDPNIRTFMCVGGVAQKNVIKMQLCEAGRVIYNCLFYYDDHIAIIDASTNKKIAMITKGIFTLRPTFHILMNGRQIGKCTKRFRVNTNTKKIKYKKGPSGEEIKLVGKFGGNMMYTKDNKKIGSLTNTKKGEYIIQLNANPADVFHLLAMCLVMVEVRHTE
ncbi:antC [Acrasis kona]|uniref:AntC n=1 Tax=Acrasis kona TaxID=1008807 RepID=A0AAW2YPH3_9EUKA